MPAFTPPGRELRGLLARWQGRGWLRGLDVAFAELLWREQPRAHPDLIFAAALASHQLGRGHACLDLDAVLRDPGATLGLPPEGRPASDEIEADRPERWLAGLAWTDWLEALDCPDLVGMGEGETPLVRQGARLYLRRYWRHEQAVAAAITFRLAASPPAWPEASMRRMLDLLFPVSPTTDWQRLACALATRGGFSLITGGPGTGKTTTVVRLLALMQALSLSGETARPLRIRLAAPTGKAAARLSAAIAKALAGLPELESGLDASMRAAIPSRAITLHRLLGSRPDAAGFRHHAGRPLALDVLVIDEASMVDLELMAAVFDALPGSARLILLGDKDQLASVEAGALLGELARRAEAGHYLPEVADWLEQVSGQRPPADVIDPDGRPLDQAVVMLRVSHRFGAECGIGRLARAVNAGAAEAVETLLGAGADDLRVHGHGTPDAVAGSLRTLVLAGQGDWPGYRAYLEELRATRPAPGADSTEFDAWARRLLERHARFQVLCAPRQGSWGVEGLNARIAGWLHEAGLIPAPEGWYFGRPVLVTRNEYALGLMNGDIGLVLPWPEADGWQARVAFASDDGPVKWVRPSRLASAETVYALTVHKSQGSEFDHVALVLPEAMSPLLNRELLYTGITRARHHLSLVSPSGLDIVRAMTERSAPRASGLMALLEPDSRS